MRSKVIFKSTGYLFLSVFLFSFIILSSAWAKKTDKVAVLRFTGPKVIDVDADAIWKMKTKKEPPSNGELTKITVDLQKSLIEQLRELVGKSVLSKSEMDKTLSKSSPDAGANKNEKLAKELNAKYLVSGSIDRLEFDGNTVMKDKYVLIITTKLIDADSGKRLWQQEKKKFYTKTFTRKTGGTVYDIFAKKQVPDVASALASDIASQMGR